MGCLREAQQSTSRNRLKGKFRNSQAKFHSIWMVRIIVDHTHDNTNMTTQSFHVKFSWNQPGFLQIGALARVTCALHVAQKGISTTTGCLGTNRRCLMVLRWTLRTDLGIVGYDYHLPKYIAIVVYHLSDSEYGLSFYIIYIYIITKADIICVYIYIYIRSTETESRKPTMIYLVWTSRNRDVTNIL